MSLMQQRLWLHGARGDIDALHMNRMFAFIFVPLVACVEDGPMVDSPRTLAAPIDPATCPTRTGGAMIKIEENGSDLTFWSTNADFIAEAKKLQESKRSKTAMFSALLDGRDCDSQWTYHVDSARMAWVSVAIEGCDGRPSDIERDKPHWLTSVKRYCPWTARVVSVEDRAR